ncbi:MAG: DUF1801 domain-containing protein [Gammaproteobacteria bacterium]|nr:DUF1801 domain-containing protein [Gammaproteobacteria bacterium]
MAEKNKTQPTSISPKDFLETVEHPGKRHDGLVLLDLFGRITGWQPRMWGPSIVGYGRYHYRYDSGREGVSLVTGFSPRKSALSIYIMPGYRDMSAMLARLGKHKIGKSCLYINKLADVELTVLEQIVEEGIAYMRNNYEVYPE